MTDWEQAISALPGHTLALCRDGRLILETAQGVRPMAELLSSGADLRGYSAADRVVGRAAAMLFLHAGVRAVYGDTMSEGALALLTAHGVETRYDRLTAGIRNRTDTGPCPMEALVADTDDAAAGAARILARVCPPQG